MPSMPLMPSITSTATLNKRLCSNDYCDYDEDNEEEDGEDGEDENNQKDLLCFAQNFQSDLKHLAAHHIKIFFKNKPFYCGGKIPKNMLINCDNILTVINYDIIDSVKKSYFFLRNHDSATQLLGEVTGDIRLVSSILHKLSAENVPQQFAGGMLILYLKYVEGVEVE